MRTFKDTFKAELNQEDILEYYQKMHNVKQFGENGQRIMLQEEYDELALSLTLCNKFKKLMEDIKYFYYRFTKHTGFINHENNKVMPEHMESEWRDRGAVDFYKLLKNIVLDEDFLRFVNSEGNKNKFISEIKTDFENCEETVLKWRWKKNNRRGKTTNCRIF